MAEDPRKPVGFGKQVSVCMRTLPTGAICTYVEVLQGCGMRNVDINLILVIRDNHLFPTNTVCGLSDLPLVMGGYADF